MSITVNTNMQALRIQTNLNDSTKKMNTAMARMASGSKINSAADDAAGYAVSTKLSKTISSSKVASDNTSIGKDLLSTTEGNLGVIQSNLSRIRDLTEQASNGTYNTDDLAGIAAEVSARLDQISSIASSTSFNGKKLLDGTSSAGVTLQVGTESSDTLKLDSTIFATVAVSGSGGGKMNLDNLSTVITGGNVGSISAYLDTIDTAIKGITDRVTKVGAMTNRLDTISDSLTVQQTNLSSALSTVKDADIASESANYVKNQILQSASATLLTQANSAPQTALTLIKG